jgi:hypothetical protein
MPKTKSEQKSTKKMAAEMPLFLCPKIDYLIDMKMQLVHRRG